MEFWDATPWDFCRALDGWYLANVKDKDVEPLTSDEIEDMKRQFPDDRPTVKREKGRERKRKAKARPPAGSS